MSAANLLLYVSWLTPPLLLLGVAMVMVRRGLRHSFPNFFTYVVYQVAITPVLLFSYQRGGDEYFYVYWATAGVGTLLGLAVLYELLCRALEPFSSLHDLSRTLFRWGALIALLFLVVFGLGVVGSVSDRVIATMLVLQRSVRVMQCALVLLMLLFASRLGLTLRHHVMGIAAGFGLFAASDLVLASIVARVDASWYPLLSTLKSLAYLASVSLWFAVLYRPEPLRVADTSPAPVSGEVFSFALPESSLPPPPDSLLMSMEKMVERRLNGHGNGNGKNGHAHPGGNGNGSSGRPH
jgi:uncharacterized membrane protein YgcG